ncbi:MAG: hypothetical protein V3V99_10250 [candidate division Zixibacteria bacterium]
MITKFDRGLNPDYKERNIIVKSLIFIFLIMALMSQASLAQECGPNCPVCSGAGLSEGVLLARNSIMVSALAVPDAEEERTVINVKYGIFNWLDAGIGYAVRTEKFIWNARIQPLMEQKDNWRPGLIIGSGSVQIGGNDQSIYAQLLKSIKFDDDFSLSVSAGAATLLPDVDEVFELYGVTAGIFENYSLFVSYDGISYHEGASWKANNWLAISFMMIESEYLALAINATL